MGEMKTEILYEDDALMVIYKPAGIATQTARTGEPDVVSELKSALSRRTQRDKSAGPGHGMPYLGVVHRLDQPVEGLLVFAKKEQAAAGLSRQLQKQRDARTFSKQYYAVLCGCPGEKEGRLVNYLWKDRTGSRAVIVDAPPAEKELQARQAVLDYRIVQEYKNLALAEICIETGRFHQIRAQMAHAGTPILGDRKYGNRESEEAARAFSVRYPALCACSLEFTHPVSNRKMNFRIKPRGEVFSFFSQL